MPRNTSRLKFFSTIFFLIIIDQVSKNAALAFLPMASGSDDYLSLAIYRNSGIAFGIPVPSGIFYFAVFIFLAVLARERFWKFGNSSKSEIAAFPFLAAGAASNMIDRIRWGYIIDFISLKGIFVFNLADAMIVAGVIILLKSLVFKNR